MGLMFIFYFWIEFLINLRNSYNFDKKNFCLNVVLLFINCVFPKLQLQDVYHGFFFKLYFKVYFFYLKKFIIWNRPKLLFGCFFSLNSGWLYNEGRYTSERFISNQSLFIQFLYAGRKFPIWISPISQSDTNRNFP